MILLQSVILSADLVISDTLQSRDALFWCESLGVHWRIRHPDENADAHDDGQAAKKDIDYLVRGDGMTVIE